MVWIFERVDETLVFEARRTNQGYEFAITHPDGSVEIRALESARHLIDQLAIVPNELMQQEWRARLPTRRAA